MLETSPKPEVEVRLTPTDLELVRTALQLLLSTLGREQAQELVEVKALLKKIESR
jgi:hypothetical protein